MMNLPHPFEKASGIQPNAQGSISLIDDQGKSLARIPLNTAFELTTESEVGDIYGYGSVYGLGYGSGYGSDGAYGFSLGYGDGTGTGDK
jgi:hypothetical protein